MSHKRRWKIPSGAIHAGEYIRPGHWKENLASAMLILAVRSSSIYVQIIRSSTLPTVTATTVSFQMFKCQHLQGVRRRISPWCVYCWGRNVEPLVLRCGEKPCRWRCQVQTLRLDFGPRRELTMQKEMTQETEQQGSQTQIDENYWTDKYMLLSKHSQKYGTCSKHREVSLTASLKSLT